MSYRIASDEQLAKYVGKLRDRARDVSPATPEHRRPAGKNGRPAGCPAGRPEPMFGLRRDVRPRKPTRRRQEYDK